MSTKTYIFQTEDGDFKVSCHIDCPSQPYQWIQSQEEKVKEGIYKDIEHALALMETSLVEYKMLEEKPEVMVYIRKGDNEPSWYTESIFYDEFGTYPENVFSEIPRLAPVAAPVATTVVATVEAEKPAEKPTETPIFGVGTRVNNPRFGNGTVIAEAAETIEINFDMDGNKKLLKKFAKIERL
jgi:hypothetical protein